MNREFEAARSNPSLAMDYTELAPWLAAFRKRYHRPLRVLHIGNIANNAYNNARLQRTLGIHADVISYDYYHVTGAPEWEEGTAHPAIDKDLPDWWDHGQRGPQRPDWFIQGPANRCIAYLKARMEHNRLWTRLQRWSVEADYWDFVQQQAEAKRRPRRLSPPFAHILARSLTGPESILANNRRGGRGGSPARAPAWAVMLAYSSVAAGAGTAGISAFKSRLQSRALERFPPLRTLKLQKTGNRPRRPDTVTEAEMSEMIQRIVAMARLDTKDLPLELEQTLVGYVYHAARFKGLLPHYDIVQGYSVDGFIPLCNGFPRYASYEHGTIRDMPFEPDLMGLVCRLTYKAAPAVFMTNTDVWPSVERLGIDPAKVHPLPAPVSIKKLSEFGAANRELVPPLEPVVFFCPARHQWKTGNASARKGNDLIVRAAAILKARNERFLVKFIEWGEEIEATKSLIEELNVADCIEWLPLLGKTELWFQYCRSHAVIDQFVMPALGGVGIECMALGRRLISRINARDLERCFGSAPPMLNAGDISGLATAMQQVLEDPSDHRGIGEASRQWIYTRHSGQRMMEVQLSAYRRLLEQFPLASANRD